MVKAIVLLCLSSVDPPYCTPDTALQRIRFDAPSLMQCMFLSETSSAQVTSPIWGREYQKVICGRF